MAIRCMQPSGLGLARSMRRTVSPSFVRPVHRCGPIRAGDKDTVNLIQSVDEEAENLTGDFCAIGEGGKKIGKRTVGEMEVEFLEAMSSWYNDGKAALTDEEFENLREELLWNGSKVAILDSDEQKFLEATIAFSKGSPIMDDAEYDALRQQLKSSSSVVTAQGPRCSIRTRKLYSDADPDAIRMTLLNLPAVLLVLGFTISLDYVSGFTITSALEAPPPIGVGLLWGVLFPSIYVLSTTLTNIGFKDFIILKGPCPSCGTENFTYFGGLLGSTGNSGTNIVECKNCLAGLSYDQNKRIIVIDETSEEKKIKIAEAEKKKAAAAAKKAAIAAKKEAAAKAKQAGSE